MKDLIICTIGNLILIAFFPVLAQWKSEVNNGAFNKLIKIKRFSFLFRAPGGISVSKEGVALPIFVSQLLGYVFALILGIVNLLCYLINLLMFKKIMFVTCLILLIEMVSLVIFDMILLKLSRSKQYFKRDKFKKQKK
jgi:hypothetical protein